jgi:catechol 2,3-dioxygenase-like lactoylglutathione lyase family enzyme
MSPLNSVEIKAFVPAKDFELSKRFYQDLGFTLKWNSDELAYFCHDNCAFFLQNFYSKDHAENFMMHLLVNHVDDWWERVQQQNISQKYGVQCSTPEQRPWCMRDFVLSDPTGVLWRIAENVDEGKTNA